MLAGLLVAVPLFAWRLSAGPLSLDFLTPYIEAALTSHDGALWVRLDSTVLAAGDGHTLEIHAINVRAYMAGNDAAIASVPEMALTLSGSALIRGVVAPNSIRLQGPNVRLIRDPDGTLQWGEGGESEAPAGATPSSEPAANAGAVVAAIKDALLGEPDSSKPGRTLRVFSIRNADLQIEDRALGTTWHAPQTDISIRRVADGLLAQGRASLDLSGERGDLGLEVAYHKGDGVVDGELRLAGIRPAMLARFGGPVAQLSIIDMPLAGSVSVRMDGAGAVERLAFDLSGGAGELQLPAPFSGSRKVAGASLRGEFGRNLARLDLSELRIDLGGPSLTVAALVDGLGGADTSIKAEAVLRDVPVDQVGELWPASLAANARDWVVPNLSKGMVREASLTLSVRSPSGKFDDMVLDHVGGEIRPEGVTVDYLRPMPPAKNTAAVCTFDASSFRIALKAGEVFGLRLKEGTIVFTGLDKEDQFADIDLMIAGPATDALRLIDSPPLRYAQALGIEPGKIGGEAVTRLHLRFPLLKALRLDDLAIKANAVVKAVKIPKVMMGLDLNDGVLELAVDAKGLDASGPVMLGSIPGTLLWRENFSAKGVPFRSRYQVKAPVVSEDQRKVLGLDGAPFVAPFIAGPVGADVTATFSDGGKAEIEAKVDLTPSAMQLPGLGWKKEAGKPGNAEVTVKLDHKLISSVPRFVVAAGDLDTRGSVSFNPEGGARRIEFAKLAYGRTSGDGAITLRPDKAGLDIVFKGASFDAEPAISRDEGDKKGNRTEADKPPAMTINATARSLWVSDKGAIQNATVALGRDAEEWRSMSVKGGLVGGKIFAATLQQQAGVKRRAFSVTSDDAGGVMRTFDIFGDMEGGDLGIEGYVDDTRKDQPFVGTIKVSDYHVRNAPVLARLVTVAALTGVVDLLQGEGVGFSSLEAPFTLADGLVEVKDVRAWGAALGITAKGQIDLDRSRIAMEGTVVPAYALNSVLGKIPVLGWLVTGGEKGGGVIAFNYTMKGSTDDPVVTVNPLSALTPGFLRNLFNIFDDGSETNARKAAPAAK